MLIIPMAADVPSLWEGLHGGASVLRKAFVVVDPTYLAVIAPAASNLRGEQTFELWRESTSDSRRSIINAQFRRPFLLVACHRR